MPKPTAAGLLRSLTLAVLLAIAPLAVAEVHTVEVRNLGPDGNRMVFVPGVVEAEPGDTVRFAFKDMGHNAMNYHPDNRGKPQLVPEGTEAWDSGFLKPGETFEVSLEEAGIHHYLCLPHESQGMVGLIAVGDVDPDAGLKAVKEAGLPGDAASELGRLYEQLAGE